MNVIIGFNCMLICNMFLRNIMNLEPLFRVKMVLSLHFLTVQCRLLKVVVQLSLCVTDSVIFLEVSPIESLQDCKITRAIYRRQFLSTSVYFGAVDEDISKANIEKNTYDVRSAQGYLLGRLISVNTFNKEFKP